MTANTNRDFNIRARKIKERWRGWSNQNHPVHMKVINIRTWLTVKRGKPPGLRNTEFISLKQANPGA